MVQSGEGCFGADEGERESGRVVGVGVGVEDVEQV